MYNGELAKKVPTFTFNTKRMSNKSRCDVLIKQMFRIWMKTLLHYVNQNESEDLRTNAFSTSTKCKSHRKNIFWICWSSLSWHYKKL